MNLRMYLAKENLKLKDFCKLVGVHPNYMSRISHGKILPGRRLAKDIEVATGGEVKLKCADATPEGLKNEPPRMILVPLLKEFSEETGLRQMTIYELNKEIDK